jgi:hypothetical protein
MAELTFCQTIQKKKKEVVRGNSGRNNSGGMGTTLANHNGFF